MEGEGAEGVEGVGVMVGLNTAENTVGRPVMEGAGATVGWVDTWWGAPEMNTGATVGLCVRPMLAGGSADGGVGLYVALGSRLGPPRVLGAGVDRLEGVKDGTGVGKEVGTALRAAAGEAVGVALGSAEGSAKGASVGKDEGLVDGSAVGSRVATAVGSALGSADGSALGAGVGRLDGSGDGSALGSEVGDLVGEGVGASGK